MIERLLKSLIEKRLYRNKAIIVIGPRQVGKTTLLKMIVSDTKNKVLEWNCDEPDVRRRLTEPTSTELKAEIGRGPGC